MILIDEILENEIPVRFYNGIDFDIILNHPQDGSGGMIICFMDRWVDEVKRYVRDSKIDYLINGSKLNELEPHINNNYVCIYQTSGNTELIYKVIRQKWESQVKQPWSIVGDTNFGILG